MEGNLDYKGVMQDMQHAFTHGKSYTLVDIEVLAVYLALVRLGDLERMAENRDWVGIMGYTPRADEG